MARQSTTPVQFQRSTRQDTAVLMTSARAGVVVPVGFVPLLPGDSASGRVAVDVQLKEMPKPLLNAVHANVQAWFVPKSAHPRFASKEELLHAFSGESIKQLGKPDRVPSVLFNGLLGAAHATAKNSDMFTTLGLHVPAGAPINDDMIDAFVLAYNFRLAAHSSKLARRKYAAENIAEATSLPPAFWPSSRLSRVVADYERALLVGSLDLDVQAGRVPVSGIGISLVQQWSTTGSGRATGGLTPGFSASKRAMFAGEGTATNQIFIAEDPERVGFPNIWAEMGGESINISLADIDKARTTQAFAKMRASYAGMDYTGFENDDTLISLMMQGIEVPADSFQRPWLLDSQRVPVGFAERFATDAANLDQSVTVGRASATLSLNVPRQDVGGVIVFTVEVLPERVDERMADEWVLAVNRDALPNALRDVQRVEPVDLVKNRRVDAKHATPDGLYGYEPMNDKWNRDFTRLGGDFYMATPGGGWTENRSNIWQTEIVNPTFSGTHYLAPQPFPHDVFADQNADAFEVVVRHALAITGLTQIGDVLIEDSDDYEAVEAVKA